MQNPAGTPTEMFALMVEAWAGGRDEWDMLAEIGVPNLPVAGTGELGARDLGRAASCLVDGTGGPSSARAAGTSRPSGTVR